MSITFTLGRRKGAPEEGIDIVDKAHSIFTKNNLLLLLGGIAIGVIMKQSNEINTLKRTVDILQEVVR